MNNNQEIRIQKMSLEDLQPARWNPRSISERALSGLRKSIEKFREFTPELQPLLVELKEHLGEEFGALKLGDLYRPRKTEEEELQEETETIVKPGDIWQLGPHRIMCGDSTKEDNVKTLMDGKVARMAFTDPPYNVDIGNDTYRQKKREGILNDDMSEMDYSFFTAAYVKQLRRIVTGDIYVCMAGSSLSLLDTCLRQAGFHWSDTIIWVKDQFVIGRGNYHKQYEPIWHGSVNGKENKPKGKVKFEGKYEPIWYGWLEGHTSSYNGSRTESDVWHIDRPKRSSEHPTMKPVELVVRALINSSLPEDLIVDLFLGSGSTLIAAEMVDRICYGMELDPHYCDVIIKRWEELSGSKATRVNS